MKYEIRSKTKVKVITFRRLHFVTCSLFTGSFSSGCWWWGVSGVGGAGSPRTLPSSSLPWASVIFPSTSLWPEGIQRRRRKRPEIMMEVKRVNEWGGGVYISGQTRAALLAISSCFFSARVCKYVQCMPIPQSLNHICFHTLKWHNFSIGALFSHLHASMRMWHNALKSYFLSVSFRSRNKFCQYSRVGKVPD